MATTRRFSAGFGRQPSRVRQGSIASYGKTYGAQARTEMANIIARYDRLIRQLRSATPTIIYDALMPVFNRSQVYVPKKTGALMASGHLQVGTTLSGRPEGSITYGGKDAPYAALVHEMTGRAHSPPTRSKFLQAALEEELDSFLVSIAADYALMMGVPK